MVALLREAGAIIIGKSKIPTLTNGLTTDPGLEQIDRAAPARPDGHLLDRRDVGVAELRDYNVAGVAHLHDGGQIRSAVLRHVHDGRMQ